MTPGGAVAQINRLLSPLIRAGVVVDSVFAHERQTVSGLFEVTFPNAEHLAEALRSRTYSTVYDSLAGKRVYNAMLEDGALIQMSYLFDRSSELKRHRLAYMGAPESPSPADEHGAGTHALRTANGPATVFRFDYDAEDHPGGSVAHPKSHLTIGRTERCRIPVSRPVTPSQFMDFVLRHFYPPDSQPPSFADDFPPCLSAEARSVAHLTIPSATGPSHHAA